MDINNFNFTLPNELIAQSPVTPRDHSKLLIYKDDKIIDDISKNLYKFLSKGDVMIFNDSRVIKSKLYGKNKRNNKIFTINLNEKITNDKDNDYIYYKIFIKNSKKIDINDILYINDKFYFTIIDKNNLDIIVKFNIKDVDLFFKYLDLYGHIPLPPYIKRNIINKNNDDEINYQTIYNKASKDNGSIASPTAGLHFTEELFSNLKKKGVIISFITLYVGAGTFLPVKTKKIEDHIMHKEYFIISKETADIINNAKANNNKIIAVGTTSLRTIESNIDKNNQIIANSGYTDIFIYPGFKFKMIDILMTNFHLPKSTLFILISAFIGIKNAHKIYKYAIDNKYRFYSYGDTSLIYK